jgi:formylmethanofuran dehydrogenase subunit C
MQTTITVEDGKISVRGPFSQLNNTRWRELGGKFAGGAWVLPDNDTSREIIRDLFGAKSDIVEVLVPRDATEGYGILQKGGYVLAQRRSRDSRVEMPDGVSLAAGSFRSGGGSFKSPAVAAESDVVFRLKCRKEWAERMKLEIVVAAASAIEI